MDVDTLLLSGGGMNCIALLGVFKYLFDNRKIDRHFKGIHTIICVSGSIIHILPLLLGLSIEATLQLFLGYDKKIIDYDEFDLNKLFIHYGLYKNDLIQTMIELVLEKKGYSKNMTFKELFTITKIDFIVKVVNISQCKIVYMNHKTHPDFPISLAARMATCIPFLFQPIKYNKDYYIDGGLCGNLPLDYIYKKKKYKKYLGINILVNPKGKIESLQDYLFSIFVIPFSPYDHTTDKHKKIITININGIGIDLNITKEMKIKKYMEGIQQTEDYFIHD